MEKMKIRPAKSADLDKIEAIYAAARQFMRENGNPTQWNNGYPRREVLEADIRQERLYVAAADDELCGVFMFALGEDPTYSYMEGGSWRSDTPYGTIHRIAGDGSGGVLAAAVDFGRQRINHLRIDTHEDNKIMQRGVAKHGFQRSGIIHLANGSPRIAYDLLID